MSRSVFLQIFPYYRSNQCFLFLKKCTITDFSYEKFYIFECSRLTPSFLKNPTPNDVTHFHRTHSESTPKIIHENCATGSVGWPHPTYTVHPFSSCDCEGGGRKCDQWRHSIVNCPCPWPVSLSLMHSCCLLLPSTTGIALQISMKQYAYMNYLIFFNSLHLMPSHYTIWIITYYLLGW
jgi:hypothetical protein